MSFEYFAPDNIQFGVCRGKLSDGDCVIIPVDESVQAVLHQMILATRSEIGLTTEGTIIPDFEPSEAYPPDSRVRLALTSPLAATVRTFYERENLPIDPAALNEPKTVASYFCIMHDTQKNKLVALRRAAQFKAILKTHLISFINDTLQAVTDTIFKLDTDFDLIVADEAVTVLHVAGLDAMAEIDDAVQAGAVRNLSELASSLPEVGFDLLAKYVSKHKRAARLVAALCARPDLALTSMTKLQRACTVNGVATQTIDGKLCAMPGHEMGLLGILDRRRYSTSLIPRRSEQYEAASRREVGVRNREQGPALAQSRGQ